MDKKEKLRKLIDLDKKVVKRLKAKAVAANAKSFKSYIEQVLTSHSNKS